MSETTKHGLENGAVLYYAPKDVGVDFCHIFRVTIKVWKDGYREVLLDSVEHENHTGRYIHGDGGVYSCGELEEADFEPGGKVEPNGKAPGGLRRKLKAFNKNGEFTSFRGGKTFNEGPVHARGEDGEPVCGTKLTHKKHKADGRWDPYSKVRCDEENVKAVWVPSYAPVTCKKCLKKMER